MSAPSNGGWWLKMGHRTGLGVLLAPVVFYLTWQTRGTKRDWLLSELRLSWPLVFAQIVLLLIGIFMLAWALNQSVPDAIKQVKSGSRKEHGLFQLVIAAAIAGAGVLAITAPVTVNGQQWVLRGLQGMHDISIVHFHQHPFHWVSVPQHVPNSVAFRSGVFGSMFEFWLYVTLAIVLKETSLGSWLKQRLGDRVGGFVPDWLKHKPSFRFRRGGALQKFLDKEFPGQKAADFRAAAEGVSDKEIIRQLNGVRPEQLA